MGESAWQSCFFTTKNSDFCKRENMRTPLTSTFCESNTTNVYAHVYPHYRCIIRPWRTTPSLCFSIAGKHAFAANTPCAHTTRPFLTIVVACGVPWDRALRWVIGAVECIKIPVCPIFIIALVHANAQTHGFLQFPAIAQEAKLTLTTYPLIVCRL